MPEWLPVAATSISLVGLAVSVAAVIYTRHSAQIARAALDMNYPYVSIRSRAPNDPWVYFGLSGSNADQWLIHSVAVKSPPGVILLKPVFGQDDYGEAIPADPEPVGREVCNPQSPLVVSPLGPAAALEFRLALKSDPKRVRSRFALQL